MRGEAASVDECDQCPCCVLKGSLDRAGATGDAGLGQSISITGRGDGVAEISLASCFTMPTNYILDEPEYA